MADEDYREERLHQIRENASRYAKAKADRVYLEHFRKSKLALLMRRYSATHETAVAQEREARADPDYLEILEGLREATEIEERTRWELRIVEMQFEAWRTRAANSRAERQRYGA